MKHFSSIKLFALAALALAGAAHAQNSVQGGPGGSVPPINTLTNTGGFVTSLSLATSASTQAIYTGRIDNNFDKGWKLSVHSANAGKFYRTGSPSGGAGRELAYTNVTFVPTGGTLGSGLTAPTGAHATQSVVTDALFTTRGANQGVLPTATSATVAYTFSLQVGWSANTALLAGTYTDDITLTLNDDVL
jgi:hypothetical protein